MFKVYFSDGFSRCLFSEFNNLEESVHFAISLCRASNIKRSVSVVDKDGCTIITFSNLESSSAA